MAETVRAEEKVSAEVLVGRGVSALVVLFMVFDGVGKLVVERHVVTAMAELGWPASQTVGLGVLHRVRGPAHVARALQDRQARVLREPHIAVVKEAESENRTPRRLDALRVFAMLAEAGVDRVHGQVGLSPP
jgi:hypothetical protein